MRIATFAPHLAGRMLPGMFDYLGIGKKERFPGDPYAHQEPWAAWFWMHTTACGSPNHIGSSRSWTIPLALRTHELQRRHSQQVLKAEGACPDATDRETAVITSPGVGPRGAWQPADAGASAGGALLVNYPHHAPGRWSAYNPMKFGSIPKFAGVYVVYFDREPVYVGQSTDVGTRFYEHKFRHGYGKNIITPWGDVPETTAVTVKLKRSRRVGDWAMWEIRLIRRLSPRFNRQHRRLRAAA